MNKNKLIIDTRQTLETRFHMFMIVTMCGRVKNAETDMCQHEIVTIVSSSYQDQLSPVLSPAPVYFLAIVNLVFSLQSTCCIWIMGMQEAEWSRALSTHHPELYCRWWPLSLFVCSLSRVQLSTLLIASPLFTSSHLWADTVHT